MQDSFENLHKLHSPEYGYEPLAWYRRREFRIFIVIFLLFSIVGLIVCFSRPPVFRSSATLTLLGDAEIDRYWTSSDINKSGQSIEPENQHIAVQNRILTAPRLLEKLWTAVNDNALIPTGVIAQFNDMRNMLSVESIVNTQLVELRASGSEPEILPVLINAWVDAYRSIRSDNINQTSLLKNEALTDQLNTLKNQVSEKRKAIDLFRQQNEIMSEVRDENPILTQLVGLNKALNKANELALKADAELESIEAAIARGEPVFLDDTNNSESLAELEKSAQKLRERVVRLEKQYTQEYIRLVPDLNAVPEQLKAVEAKIAGMGQVDQGRVLSIARQDARATNKKVRRLQQQLADHKHIASEFTARFSEYKEMQIALQNLEAHYRSTEDKILKTEVRQHQKYPDIEVISKAFLPQQRISPDYPRDAALILVASFLLGLIGVWVANFLVPKEVIASPGITLSGLHMYSDENLAGLPPVMQTPQLPGRPSILPLEQSMPEELTDSDLHLFWQQSTARGKQLIGILLSGISIDEAALIETQHIDLQLNTIDIQGDHSRTIEISEGLAELFRQSKNRPAWQSSCGGNVEDLVALLACLATDADMDSHRFSNQALRHSYLLYLVRQGVKLSELADQVGYISPSALTVYRAQSPQGAGKVIGEIDRVHPLLKV